MREVTQAYKDLRLLADCHYEIQIVRGSVTYGMDDILEAKLTQQLFSEETGPSVGGVTASMLRLTLFESGENWPRMASFELKVRLWDAENTRHSEWLSFGTFWTDTRAQSKNKVKLTLTGYDGMLLLEKKWTDLIPEGDLPANWPITSAAAARLLQQASGVQLEAGTALDDRVTWFGLDTRQTVRRAWASIAAAEGRNIIMTPAGTLRLVPLTGGDQAPGAVAGVAVAGLAVAGVSGGSGAGSGAGETYIGLDMKSLSTSPDLAPVHSVQLQDAAGSIASAGTGDYKLKGLCEFSDSSAVATICLQNTYGYVYRPFEANSVRLDPAVELGDLAYIKDGWRQITMIQWRFGSQIYADISAPIEEAVDHEYTVESEPALSYRKAVQKASEALTNWIDGDFADTVEDLEGQIDRKAETWYQSADPSAAWTTEELRERHTGDLWYDTATGKTYYFNGTAWQLQNIPEEVFDAIDGKANVFVAQPAPPYDVGDLWVQGAGGDILKCVTAKATGESYAAADWEKASKYTDDSALDNYYTKSETESYIQQNAERIVLGVTETRYYDRETVDTQNQELSGEISVEHDRITAALSEILTVDGEVEEIQSYIRYEMIDGVGTVVIGQSDSLSEFRVSNEQIAAVYNNEIVSYWNQDRQYTPKQLQIPLGGSLRLGNILWQPRTSGNLSIFLVNS